MAAVELVVTDLDDTLWTGNGDVPLKNHLAIAEIERRGVTVLAATSRRLGAVRMFFEQAGLQLPSILLNGALGTTNPRNTDRGEFFVNRQLQQREALQILHIFKVHGLAPQVYVESEALDLVCSSAPSSGAPYVALMRQYMTFVADLEGFVQETSIYGISVVGGTDFKALELAAVALRTMTTASVDFQVDNCYGGHTLVAGPPGTTKWKAVLSFCERYGFNPNAVLAVGDGLNDLDLMRNATIACAMSHAVPEVTEAADLVLSNGVEGWSGIIAHV